MRLEGFYIQFSEKLDEVANRKLQSLCNVLLDHLLPGVTELYPGYRNLYIEYDAKQVSKTEVETWVQQLQEHDYPETVGKTVSLPVRYDGEDLPFVSEQTGLSISEIIRLHSEPTYHVYAVGFTPGFPLMGKLNDVLYLPRRKTPRKKVPAHSVAMAVSQTAVYPQSTPGGWHLLGTSLKTIYDPHRENPFLLSPGDAVKFEMSDGPTPDEVKPLELLPSHPRHPVLRVEEPGLLDMVVDRGRFMVSRFGLARSGPMDAYSAHLANALVGNKNDLPLLELSLKGPVFTALRDVLLGFAGYGMQPIVANQALEGCSSFLLKKGQVLRFKPTSTGARAYLAIAGGIESKVFLGSSSTDLYGCIGRVLKAGDIIGASQPSQARARYALSPYAWSDLPIRLLLGPQANAEALARLTQGSFRIGSADRMGVRLEGPRVPGGELISEATPMGAIQITTEGQPIILLNDRGRIGGYAKPVIVDPRDLPRITQMRLGQKLRFCLSKA
jgi:KipI family sensor histidine kinase inhibitor